MLCLKVTFSSISMEKSRSRSQSPKSSPKLHIEELEGQRKGIAQEYKTLVRGVLAKKIVKELVSQPDNLEESIASIDNKKHTPESVAVIAKNVVKVKEGLKDSISKEDREKPISEKKLKELENMIIQEEKELKQIENELAIAIREEGKERGAQHRNKLEKKLKRKEKEKKQQEKIKAFFESLPHELKKGFDKIFKKNKN